MTWLTLLIISICTYAVGVLLQRVLMKDQNTDPVAYAVVSNIIAGTVVGIYAMFKGVSFEGIFEVIPNLILMTVLYAISNIMIFRSLKLIEASEFTVLFATRAVWSILAAVLILKESFNLQQVSGTILIIISVILVTMKSFKIQLGKGQIFALIAALAFGFEFINDAVILGKVDVFLYIPIIFIIPSLLLWGIYPKSTKHMGGLFKSKFLPKLIILGVLYGVSATTFLWAYQVGNNAAQLSAINQTSTILAVFLSVIFLKERTSLLKKLIAAIISFFGVILVK